MSDAFRPMQLNLDRRAGLHIRWADGHESAISLIALRKACPCAGCRQLREEQAKPGLHILQPGSRISDQVTVDRAELVGNYALRVAWNDGHDTGIFDFRLLRAMCNCPACQSSRRP